jgi:HEAT repeats
MTRCATLQRCWASSGATAMVAMICLLQFGGCSRQPPPPTLTGGKPLSYWLGALRAPDAGTRKNAVFELGNVGPLDPAVIPALTAALQDRDARVRCAAILALVKSPKEAVAALPMVQVMADRDSDPTVRNYAARAAKKLEESKPAEDSRQ